MFILIRRIHVAYSRWTRPPHFPSSFNCRLIKNFVQCFGIQRNKRWYWTCYWIVFALSFFCVYTVSYYVCALSFFWWVCLFWVDLLWCVGNVVTNWCWWGCWYYGYQLFCFGLCWAFHGRVCNHLYYFVYLFVSPCWAVDLFV